MIRVNEVDQFGFIKGVLDVNEIQVAKIDNDHPSWQMPPFVNEEGEEVQEPEVFPTVLYISGIARDSRIFSDESIEQILEKIG